MSLCYNSTESISTVWGQKRTTKIPGIRERRETQTWNGKRKGKTNDWSWENAIYEVCRGRKKETVGYLIGRKIETVGCLIVGYCCCTIPSSESQGTGTSSCSPSEVGEPTQNWVDCHQRSRGKTICWHLSSHGKRRYATDSSIFLQRNSTSWSE